MARRIIRCHCIHVVNSSRGLCVKVAQSRPTLYNPMDYTVHGILQIRILDWVAFLEMCKWKFRKRSEGSLEITTVHGQPMHRNGWGWVRKMCNVIKVWDSTKCASHGRGGSLSWERWGSRWDSGPHFKYCRSVPSSIKQGFHTRFHWKRGSYVSKKFENHDSGPQMAQETASVKQTGAHLLLRCLGRDPDSGWLLESCPQGSREETLSQAGLKLLPWWGGKRGLEEVRVLARKISGQGERGQGQSQKQRPHQQQKNQGQPGKDRGQTWGWVGVGVLGQLAVLKEAGIAAVSSLPCGWFIIWVASLKGLQEGHKRQSKAVSNHREIKALIPQGRRTHSFMLILPLKRK